MARLRDISLARLTARIEEDPQGFAPYAPPEKRYCRTPGDEALSNLRRGGGRVKEINPPPLPTVFLDLQRIVNDPRSTTDDIAAALSKDPGLVTSVLRIANSGFYSFLTRVDTVSRAVALIGSREICMLVLGASVLHLFKDCPDKSHFDLKRFWEHSIACAALASIVAGQAGRIDLERCFIAGLLHDIGRMLLCMAEPELAAETMSAASGLQLPLYMAEQEILGFDHAELAGIMARKWRFPSPLAAAVRYHHAPEHYDEPDIPGVVHLADLIAKALGYSVELDPILPPLSEQAWNDLELHPDDLDVIVETLDEELPGYLSAFTDD